MPAILPALDEYQKIFAIKILISFPLVPGTDRSSQSCCGHTVVSVLCRGTSPERPSPPEWHWRLGDPKDRDCNRLMENLYPLLPSSMGTFLNLEPLLLEPLAPARLLSHSADRRPSPFSPSLWVLMESRPFWDRTAPSEVDLLARNYNKSLCFTPPSPGRYSTLVVTSFVSGARDAGVTRPRLTWAHTC